MGAYRAVPEIALRSPRQRYQRVSNLALALLTIRSTELPLNLDMALYHRVQAARHLAIGTLAVSRADLTAVSASSYLSAGRVELGLAGNEELRSPLNELSSSDLKQKE